MFICLGHNPSVHLPKEDRNPNDFGHVIEIGADNLTDQQKLHYLEHFFTPPRPPLHEWPAETRTLNGKKIVRRLNPSFIERTDCNSMAYSPMYGGLFCRYVFKCCYR